MFLFHKIRGNEDNPRPDELAVVKESISKRGLIAQLPDEWKGLLPTNLQHRPVVWLFGSNRIVKVKRNLLDKSKLFRIDCPEVDWWVYTDNIPPKALEFEMEPE